MLSLSHHHVQARAPVPAVWTADRTADWTADRTTATHLVDASTCFRSWTHYLVSYCKTYQNVCKATRCLNHNDSRVQQLRTESSIAFAKYSDLALLSPANEILPSLVMYTWCLLVMFSTCIAIKHVFSNRAQRPALSSAARHDVYAAEQQLEAHTQMSLDRQLDMCM